jgi:hypothetical protein
MDAMQRLHKEIQEREEDELYSLVRTTNRKSVAPPRAEAHALLTALPKEEDDSQQTTSDHPLGGRALS